ncbi:MAG: hypothetical protein HOP20_10705 [Sulfuriferula sp.]|nr:hypothetical protein [Sulfuriferula sp.]
MQKTLSVIIAGLVCNVAYAAPDAQKDCKSPYQYFRKATATDYACVTSERPAQVIAENTNPVGTTRIFGNCISGYVERGVDSNDKICVTQASHTQVLAENADQPNRVASTAPSGGGTPAGTGTGGRLPPLGSVPDGVKLPPGVVKPVGLGNNHRIPSVGKLVDSAKPDLSGLMKTKTVTITADQIPAKAVKCAQVDGADNRGPSVLVTGTAMLCFAYKLGDSEIIKHDYTDTVDLSFINPHFKILPMGIKYMVARQGEHKANGEFRLIDAPFDKSLYENKSKDQWGANGGVYIYGNANMVVSTNALTLTHPMWQNHTSPSWGSKHSNEFVTGSSITITVEGPANEDPIKR